MRLVQLQELDETRARCSPTPSRSATWPRPRPRTSSPRRSREADQLRLASQQEANDLRTSAKRESEQARAAADREVQEARRTLAVEKERLTKEASEHHTNATAETQRLVAGGRGAGHRRRGAGPRGHDPGQRPPAAGADRGGGAAHAGPPRGRADRRLGRTQADSITATGTAEAERELAAVRPRSSG